MAKHKPKLPKCRDCVYFLAPDPPLPGHGACGDGVKGIFDEHGAMHPPAVRETDWCHAFKAKPVPVLVSAAVQAAIKLGANVVILGARHPMNERKV